MTLLLCYHILYYFAIAEYNLYRKDDCNLLKYKNKPILIQYAFNNPSSMISASTYLINQTYVHFLMVLLLHLPYIYYKTHLHSWVTINVFTIMKKSQSIIEYLIYIIMFTFEQRKNIPYSVRLFLHILLCVLSINFIILPTIR